MTATEFVRISLESAVGTMAYLLAYRGAPVVALAVSVLLIALSPHEASLRWARDDRATRSAVGGLLLGLTRPVAKAEIEANLRRLADRPLAIVVYLVVSHALTPYYLLLIGPLLGKDVLLSHGIGAVLFIVVAWALVRLLVPASAPSGDATTGRSSFGGTLVSELGRVAALMGVGLVIGGAIAAWGLSSWTFAPAELVESRWLSQASNAIIGLGISSALGMWPIANLFVATYLWKIGLAHAGLVAFFCAAVVSPQRVALYARVLGRARAARLALALALAAPIAGLGTAIVYRLTGLTIRYKLISEQLL
ncbi:MAG: hypothetical protein ACREQ9_04035 [Candidatus Binatia bacterium]